MSDAEQQEADTVRRLKEARRTDALPSRRQRRIRRTLRVLLVLLVFGLLTQLPFIYRAFELRALRHTIHERPAARTTSDDRMFREYVGAFHVHTSLGGHSTGTPAAVIRAAQANQLDFVVMTEHTEGDYDSSAMTLQGVRGGVLFIPGNETQAASGSRFLVLPGAAETGDAGKLAAADFTAREREAGRAVFAAYPAEFRDWDAAEYDGIEIYNLFTNARKANRALLFFDGLWFYSFPELVFTRFYERPADALAKWDELATKRPEPLAGIAGGDAHANVGIHLQLASGERLAGIQLDPYERSFRIVRMHILLRADEALTADTLLAALRTGRSFIAFDVFGDTTGFRFTAGDGAETRTMGEQIQPRGETTLRVRMPAASRVVLLRNGEKLEEARGTEATFQAKAPGAYRVEVYLDDSPLLAGKPWIISNHINVKRGTMN